MALGAAGGAVVGVALGEARGAVLTTAGPAGELGVAAAGVGVAVAGVEVAAAGGAPVAVAEALEEEEPDLEEATAMIAPFWAACCAASSPAGAATAKQQHDTRERHITILLRTPSAPQLHCTVPGMLYATHFSTVQCMLYKVCNQQPSQRSINPQPHPHDGPTMTAPTAVHKPLPGTHTAAPRTFNLKIHSALSAAYQWVAK